MAVFLILLLLGMGYQWVDDLRNDRPKRREFASMYKKIVRVNKSLSLLEFRISQAADQYDRNGCLSENSYQG